MLGHHYVLNDGATNERHLLVEYDWWRGIVAKKAHACYHCDYDVDGNYRHHD
jgi:hypothetical protein